MTTNTRRAVLGGALVVVFAGGAWRTAGVRAEDGQELREAKRLFEHETFGGNGRTCRTCHSPANGTLTLQQIADRFAEDAAGPLFRGDGTDDGQGNGTSRIRADGTILVSIPLPPGVSLSDDPSATSVTLRRGIPSTINTPALDPVLMYDGRAANLVEQARAAVNDHAGHTIEPTEAQLALIADFQRTRGFFSSDALRLFAEGGPPPELPEGRTASERRGRRFFDDVPIFPPDTRGICAVCHSGPMLNEVNEHNPIPVPPFRVEPGTRFQSILSAELLPNGDPFRPYVVTNPDATTEVVVSSDPGRALQTGDFRGFPFGNLGQFKIPMLWNVKNNAPYFHNNGAKTLEAVLDHYQQFFIIATPGAIPGAPPIVLTDRDRADIIAFLKLL
jgi:cytochrome c peroxidase